MKVVMFSSQKGGSGKSTLTVLAATTLATNYGCRVLVVDSDPQLSLVNLRENIDEHLRPKDAHYLYPIVSKEMSEVADYLDEQEDNYDVCFIDMPGRSDNAMARTIISLCDMVVVPYSPSDFNRLSTEDFLRGLLSIQASLGEHPFACFALQNEYSSSRRIDQDLTLYLQGLEIPTFDTIISARACYMTPSTLHSYLTASYRREMGVPVAVAKEIAAFATELFTKLALAPEPTAA